MIRLLAALLACLPGAVLAQTWPDRTAPYVNDYAGLMDTAQATGVSHRLAGLHFIDGVEMTVLTLTSRADYGYAGTMEDMAHALFQRWELGKTTGDDGILVLILWDDREMRIELGQAYGSAFNATAADVIDTAFVPQFLDDRPGAAIVTGVEATIDRIALADAPEPANDATPVEPPPATGGRGLSGEN